VKPPEVAPVAERDVAVPDVAPGPESAPCSVFYRFDEYAVPDEYRGVLEMHADYLKSDPRARLRVVGNADERGSREYNLALAQRRAEAVRSLLVELGVRSQQVVARSNGEERPRIKGRASTARASNRRTDLVYTRHRLPLPRQCVPHA
jgi:peptidoglycan-associated lipoprotein